MPIDYNQHGRLQSFRTEEEEDELLLQDIGNLSAEEQRALLEIFEQMQAGNTRDHQRAVQVDFARRPVDIHTFLSDPYFFGHVGASMYDELKDSLVELFNGRYAEGLLGGSIGWGKSYFAGTAMAYVLYQMSCLRKPQAAYGIDPGSHIYIAMLSVTEKVSKRVQIADLQSKVQYSPYFKEHFPGKAAPSNLEIRFPNNIQIVGGSTGSSAIIGLNVFSGFIDETSFMGESKEVDRMGQTIVTPMGEKIYKSIIRRMKSRFQRSGRLPGVLLVVSSKERPNAFIEKRIEEAREADDKTVFVREYATWHVKPKEHFSDEWFFVAAGNDRIQSRILGQEPTDEEVYECEELGLQVVKVPMDYWIDFQNDIDGSLREIAGIATESTSNFLHRLDAVFQSIDDTGVLVCPFGTVDPITTWVAGSPLPINWGRIAQSYERRLPGGYTEVAWKPLRHPSAPRHVHIDTSLSADATGVAMSHISGWTEVIRRDHEGVEYKELAPRIETDFLLRIVPPPGDEILLSDVRAIIYMFQDHGFHIAYASTDSYQSADTRQQFAKRGITTEVVSVDRTMEPYDVLKTCFYEGRLKVHEHPWLMVELRNLQRIQSSGRKMKIDHPSTMSGPNGETVVGSKDVADALSGVAYSLMQRLPGRPLAPMLGISQSPGGVTPEKADYSWVTDGSVMITDKKGGKRREGRSRVGAAPPVPGGVKLPFTKG